MGRWPRLDRLISRPNGGNDLRVSWTDADTEETKSFEIDLDGAETINDVVTAIDAKVKTEFSNKVSFSYDEATGKVKLSDTDSLIIVDTDVIALFGAAEAASADDGGQQVLALDGGFTGFADELIFTLSINDTPVEVTIPAEAGRSEAGFVAAFTAALQDTNISRGAISDTAVPGVGVPLGNLIEVVSDGGGIRLVATNFAEAAGYDPITFAVSGEDQSKNIEFRLTDLGGANIAKALGFKGGEKASDGDMVSETLYEAVSAGAPRVYLDTAKTGITASFIAGVNDGLNIKLGLGPIEVQVQNGRALINAGDGSGDPAFLKFLINDIDGDTHEDQYDLTHLFDIPNDPALGFADLFGFDAKIGVDVVLPLSDNLGLFDPAVNRLSWQADLLSVVPGMTLTGIDFSDLGASFNGDLISLYEGNGIDMSNFEFGLPDLSEFLSNLNVLALLNDPRLVLGGLDMLLGQMQTQFDNFLGGINLPVVGDAIGAGVSFFDDFRYNVVKKALAYAQEPLADGSLPTTVDLLTGFVNDALNDLLGTTGEEYLQAYLDTSGSTEESYIYGVLNFNAIIFNEMMDIDFDFGIPGFNMEVEQGSQIQMQLDYAVSIGFGFDQKGFFLLNDTDDNEVGINFLVDAGTFEGSMKVFDVLGINAQAVTLDGSGNIIQGAGGTAQITASLGADLFGDSGLDIVDPASQPSGADAISGDTAYRDFSNVTPLDGSGNALDWEKVVYVAQLDTAQLIAFSFEANFDVQIGLEANILDPTNGGQPVEIGGLQVLPSVLAEIVFDGMYSTADGLQLNKLLFNNVRLDASVLYDALIAPILDPINGFIEPLADFFNFLSTPPVSYVADILGNVFPIIGLVNSIANVTSDILNFVQSFQSTGGMVLFGDFDFTANLGDMQSGEKSISQVDRRDIQRSGPNRGSSFGTFGSESSGFSISIPLLQDPFSAMSILTGNFDQVDLIRARYTLFNLNTGVIDIGDEVLRSMGAPGWVRDIISSVFSATIEARLIAKFEAGYDLSGIVNFANSLDPERLLDGVFIDAAPGSLVDAYIGASMRLNAGLAGISASGHAGVQLSFNDPNDDGKLRIPELIAIVDAALNEAGNPLDSLGYIFKGTASVGFYLRVWAGINLPWPLPDLSWSTTVFNIDESINFGGNLISAQISAPTANDDTAILNVGARAGASMSKIEGDGNDVIRVSGPNSPYAVTLNSDGQSISGQFNEFAGGIIIPAGNGNNTVDLSNMSAGLPTITYTGDGRDTIMLPDTGVHVVFAGDGIDTITAGPNASGTYIIFGEGDADTVNIPGGNVVYFGNEDFGMRDVFLAEFATGGVTQAGMLELLGINADGTVNAAAAASYTFGGGNVNLSTLLEGYTQGTQLKGSKDIETVIAGGGNHVILTSGGNDVITTALNGTGEVYVLSGAGADTITTGGSDVFIEGGAGRDLINVDGAQTEVWGWGAAAGEDGLTADDLNLNALALKDGADVIIGGSGADTIYGQLGADIIEGGLGADALFGGFDDDFISGGTFDMSFVGGGAIDITNFDITGPLTRGLIIETSHLADGDDEIDGGIGADVLLGGGGSDTMRGGTENDILIGDFARVTLSSNLIAEGAITTHMDSAFSGTDNLDGGRGNDILIAGAALPGESETLLDMYGDNTFLGDFGEIKGARILEAATQVISIASTAGGADTITAGRGNDLVIGGEGNDIINTGLGGDLILGDNGVLDISQGTVTALGLDSDGNDRITVGVDTPSAYTTAAQPDLKDIIAGGLGNDLVIAQSGGLAMIGDAGVITLNPVALNALRTFSPAPSGATQEQLDAEERSRNLIDTITEAIESTADARDGNDQLTTTGGEAIAVLGGGADATNLADGVNYILGDDGRITIDPNDDYTGRLIGMQSAESLASNTNDSLVAGNGVNLVVGGEGADTITLGDGDNVALGDSGSINHDTRGATPIITGVSRTHADDGVDTITVGNGDNVIVGGGAGDIIGTGTGDNAILGDSGDIASSDAQLQLRSLDAGTGGADRVTTQGGDDHVILGDDADIANLGDGDNRVLGDSGTITSGPVPLGIITSGTGTGNGADQITTGTGADAIIGGLGADVIHGGSGDNVVIGDFGTIQVDPGKKAIVAHRAETSGAGTGDGDQITTLEGADVILGGGGADTVRAGDGADVILGDDGLWESSHVDGLGGVASTIRATGDNDRIFGEAGNDLILGNLGDDYIEVGAGEDVALGDDGIATFRNHTDVETVVLTNLVLGGADTITAAGLSGDNILIGNAGGDVITGGTSDDTIAGDIVTLLFESYLNVLPGQSAHDRIIQMTGQRPDIGYNDVLNGDAGNDILMGGFGADSIHAMMVRTSSLGIRRSSCAAGP